MDALLFVVAVALALLVGVFVGAARERRRLDADAERQREQVSALSHEITSTLVKSAQDDLQRRNAEDHDLRQRQIEEMLKPFRERLDTLQKTNTEMHRQVSQEYGKLFQQLGDLQRQTTELGQHSRALSVALKGSSQARGTWGETALRNIVELAHMTEHCDFVEQETGEGGSRPDMLVRLPEEDRIPVDAKASFSAYQDAVGCDDPEKRAELQRRHAQDVRARVLELAKKRYDETFGGRIDFTVMFVPSEPVLSMAFEALPTLQDEAMQKRVLIATPVTLMALLRTTATMWSLAKKAEHAQDVWEEANEFLRRVTVFTEKHLAKVGKGLAAALKSYNDAIGSYESRVLPQGRKVEALEGPQGGKPSLPDIPAVEGEPRALRVGAAPEGEVARGDGDAVADAEAAAD